MAESESFDDRKWGQVWATPEAVRRGQRLQCCNAAGVEGPLQPLTFGADPGDTRPRLSRCSEKG